MNTVVLFVGVSPPARLPSHIEARHTETLPAVPGAARVVVIDLDGLAEGVDALEWVKEWRASAQLLVMTELADPTLLSLVSGMRAEFLLKPVSDEAFAWAVHQLAVDDGQVSVDEFDPDASQPGIDPSAARLVGSTAAMRDLRHAVGTIARVKTTVLVQGEDGTGKGSVAKEIHLRSRRAEGPFVTTSCAGGGTISTNSFLLAQGGTLFLDDIQEMGPDCQALVLRVLQEGHVPNPQGGSPVPLDVRVIASSDHSLPDRVAQETFRSDLFYRLSVFPLDVPTLRARTADVPVLFMRFLADANSRHELEVAMPPAELLRTLTGYAWPGNVRQLENYVEQYVVTNGMQPLPTPRLPDLPPADGGLLDAGIDLGRTLQEIERSLIREALKHCGGNRAQAARLLGLKRTTLIEKIKRLGDEKARDDHSITLDPAFRPVIVMQAPVEAGSKGD